MYKSKLSVEEVLAQYGGMEDNVILYVPSTIGSELYKLDSPIIKPFIKKVIGIMSDLFGGATGTIGSGGWIGDDGELIEEPVMMVKSYMASLDMDKIIDVIELGRELKSKMKQQAISMEVNGKLYFL